MSIFYPLDVVGRGSGTQLQLDEILIIQLIFFLKKWFYLKFK